MRSVRAACALAGLLGAWTPCGAARVVTVGLEADRTTVAIGGVVSWTVRVSWVADEFPPDAWTGGFVGAFVANEPTLGESGAFESLLPRSGSTPASDRASVLGVNVFQSALLGDAIDDGNPLALFRFEVVTARAGELRYHASGSVAIVDFPHLPPGSFELATASETVTVVPSPGAGPLVGAVGLLGARRRRPA